MFKWLKNRKRGITSRWVAASLVLTIFILAGASAILILSLRQSWYSDARQTLETRALETISSIYRNPADQRNNSLLLQHVQNFANKDKYELMLVNEDGVVTATSSGYALAGEEPLDDYTAAAESDSGKGYFIGQSANGEHIMAVTHILSSPIGDTVAIRYVSSLTQVDRQLWRVSQVVVLICLVILLFSVFTGLYFVRSIVIPIGRIGHTASKIADGDFDVRVENNYNDEIGELCDIINNMAAGLSVSERVKNEFISSVSHELRTPLTSIKGWGETLKNVGAKDEKVLNKGIDIIVNETERLSVLVEDLLDFSRMQSGNQMRFVFDVVDMEKELQEAVQIFEQRAANLKIQLACELPGRSVLVSADKNRLRQVFSNLLDNAIKYSKQECAITVSLETAGGKAVVRVTDHGAGIPKKDLASITERFFKASNALTGSGIGLAVVKEIIVMHDGTLTIDSELGRGTTVIMELPLLDVNEV